MRCAPALAADATLVARFYERLGDHAVHIAVRVPHAVDLMPAPGRPAGRLSAMRTSNPALNDKVFEQARTGAAAEQAPGWAALERLEEAYRAPAYRGPVVGEDTMTVNGAVWASAALLVLVVAAGVVGWNSVDQHPRHRLLPRLVFRSCCSAASAWPWSPSSSRSWPGSPRRSTPCSRARSSGAISGVYNTAYDGIVVQAVSLTIGVFAVMLFLFATRIIKVTDKLRMGIVAATGAILLVYLLNLVLSLFDAYDALPARPALLGIGDQPR